MGRSSLWTGAGAVLSAALASACCWLPLVAVALGFSAGGAGARFERYRLPLLLAAFAFLALGTYLNERRPACAPDGTCPEPRPGLKRFNRVVLALCAVLTLLLAAFPDYAGRLSSVMEAPSESVRPLVRLSPDGRELRRDFNRDRAKVRLVLLLSPS
jgi:mercuric ion transport protein